jgi:hypothetical protein
MTMAKSTTKNKSIEFDIEKIKRFAEAELNKLVNNEMPFCFQIGNDTVVVGCNKVVRISTTCWRVYNQGQEIFDFFNRKDAIFYCIAAHKKNFQLAESIKDNDALLGKLEFDARMYRHRYKQAQEVNDQWKIDLYSNKYSEIVLHIDRTKKELLKSIRLT